MCQYACMCVDLILYTHVNACMHAHTQNAHLQIDLLFYLKNISSSN